MAEDWNAKIIAEFRANEGRVGGQFEGSPLLLLHSIGARSGVERVNPMAFQATNAGLAVFASAAGADKNPDWYHNLLAHPDVRIEVGVETLDVHARVVDDPDEREVIWAAQKRDYPGFADYESMTSRVISVVLLEIQR
ncbi:MAG: nitroreductase family deazaflavin-dependent oxidoreductase [Jatrophihabitans sp.]